MTDQSFQWKGNHSRPTRLGRMLLLSVATIATASGALAQAQTAPSDTPPVAVQQSASGLEEIIVTAQRRSENLQVVPVSVKAFTADALAQQNIKTGLDIAKLVPAVSIEKSSGNVQIFIRGIGNSVDSQGNENSNALYIDGIYYSRLVPNLFRFNNIERIEVLKGPQGTLFGRNAEGGLVQIVTKTPTPGAGITGEVNVGYGSFDTLDTGAYVSTGLGDKAAADIAFNYYNNKGFGRNVFNGRKANYEKSYAGRSKIVLAPTENTRIILSGDYSKNDTDQGIPGQKPGGPYPGSANTGFKDNSGLLPFVGFYNVNVDGPRNYASENYGGSLRIEQQLGFAKFISISAYHKNKELYNLDNDFGPQPVNSTLLPAFTKQFTQEFQLQSNSGSAFNWTLGAFYLNTRTGYKDALISGQGFAPPGSALRINSSAPVDSYAGYGQATFAIVPKLKLTVGARVSNDQIRGNGNVDIQFNNGGPRITAVPFNEAKKSDTRLTGKGVLAYQATDDVMTYISASRGYKSGLYNILTFSPTLVKAEVLDSFEAGIKSELFDKKVRFNAAIFYNNFKNPQVQVVSPASLLFLINAGKARTTGAEFDAVWVPTSNLTLMASGSYLNAKYTDFPNAPFYTPNPRPPFGVLPAVAGNANGKRLPKSPEFSGNIGFVYKVPVGDGRFLISSRVSYTDKFFWTPENRDFQSAYALLDARVSYEFKNGLTLSAWGTNLTDKKYQSQGQTQPGFGGDFGAPGAPRQYGVTANLKF